MHAKQLYVHTHSARISVSGTPDLTLTSHHITLTDSRRELEPCLSANRYSAHTRLAERTCVGIYQHELPWNVGCIESYFYSPRTRDPKECHSDFGWEYETFWMEPRLTELPLTYLLACSWETQGDPHCCPSLAQMTFWTESQGSFPRDKTLLPTGKDTIRFCEFIVFGTSLP